MDDRDARIYDWLLGLDKFTLADMLVTMAPDGVGELYDSYRDEADAEDEEDV